MKKVRHTFAPCDLLPGTIDFLVFRGLRCLHNVGFKLGLPCKNGNELGASLNAGGINTQGLYFSIWSRHDYDEFAAAMTG